MFKKNSIISLSCGIEDEERWRGGRCQHSRRPAAPPHDLRAIVLPAGIAERAMNRKER